MKKIFMAFIFFVVLYFFPKDSLAYQQSEGVCYSQCAAHKFVWKGDFCWDMFQSQCSMGSKDAVDTAIDLVKDSAKAMATGKLKMIVDVDPIFTQLFICKPLIEDCIVPILAECKKTCTDISDTYYAPNLYVGNQYGSTVFQNIYYDEDRHQLTFKVTNNGGYAWDIDVTASWGHTGNRDKIVSGGGTLFTEKIPEMLFFGARVGSPKEPGDYVTDFLIDQSNFSNWLGKYKSDADNHYIPPAWYKTIPFTAPAGEYTKITLNVDPNNIIPEASEGDNMTIYEIDNLPTPVYLTIENFTFKRTNPTDLTEYSVNFNLKNSGEEGGNAHIKWYDGSYQPGSNTIFEQNQTIAGLNKASFDHDIIVDVSRGRDSCNSSHKYTLMVFDDEGFIKTRYEFSIPTYAGSIYGRVDDIFGKKVVGATVSTSTGQTTTTDNGGNYYIGGIPTLGLLTLTVTHPDFSRSESKEMDIKFDDSKDKCQIEGLTHTGINFVLKDQDVVFTVTLKDTAGNPINGHVLATNKMSDDEDITKTYFRLDKDINGTGELGALQPGEYMFTIDAGGYKTIAQTVSAVPNNQNLEFILEPLLGRKDEGNLLIQPPQLLWQMDRGTEIVSKVSATKDGKRVILYTTKNKADTGKLYFLDSVSGNQVKAINTPATGGNSKACLSTSYDGNTTALLVHKGVPGISDNKDNSLILFDNQGHEFARHDQISGNAVDNCAVSPDGFYIFPGFLINKSLYAYSRMEIMGLGGYSTMGYTPPVYFLHGNGLIAGCEGGGGNSCAMTIARKELTRYNGVSKSRITDSSFNDQRVIFGDYDKLFVYGGGTKSFEKDVNASGQEPSASITLGSHYIIYTHNEPKVHNADFKIVNADNVDLTPVYEKDVNENVIFVHANDKGLFYLTERGKTLKYYQVGKYTTEYNPPTQVTPASPSTTSGLSFYNFGSFLPAGDMSYAALEPGYMYRADRTLTLKLSDSGSSLYILEGTIFSLDGGRHPILLKGQMTADFKEPMIIYAIKFDRFDLALFRTKLNQFWRIRTLPESEYFVIKNIHTKFTLKNYPNTFNVLVDSGQVNVLADKTEKVIDSGKQISIDASNEIKESIYLSSKIFTIIIGVLIVIGGVFLFVYRKTKIGGKIIFILKKTAVFIWKMIKIIMPILWKWIKIGVYGLIKLARTVSKRLKKN